MKITLAEIKNATISELSELQEELSFEIEVINIQLNGDKYRNDDKVWREKATKARKYMESMLKLVNARHDRIYYAENRFVHGAILAEVKKIMTIGDFMRCVHRGKNNAGLLQ